MARLFVLSGNSIGATFDLYATSTVGRGDDADIVIPEASVSRKHARLVPRTEAGTWKVVDLKSSNGLFVGGKRVASGIIRDGDTFRLGEVELRLREEVGAGEEALPEDPEVLFADELVDEEDELDDEFELEFGEDLDDAIQTTAHRAPSIKPAAQQRPASAETAGARAGARTTEQRNQRRQQALKGPGAAARGQANPAGGGSPVLQYAAANHRSTGADLAQMSSGRRALLILLSLALMGGLAYGAFTLTRTARSQSAVVNDLPDDL